MTLSGTHTDAKKSKGLQTSTWKNTMNMVTEHSHTYKDTFILSHSEV